MGDASIRIGVLHFSHETVTFLKNDTTLEDFIYPGSPAKGEALLKFDPRSYMGGFVKMAREFGRVASTQGPAELDQNPQHSGRCSPMRTSP
jgi:metallopeptidase family M81